MIKDDKVKSEPEDISDIKFIDALNDLIENLPHRKGAKKDLLLKLIRSYYETDDDLFKITSIPLDDLVKKIYFPGEKAAPAIPKQIKDKRKNFSSLKSSLNKNLRILAEEGRNYLGIIVGKSNAFNISQAVELKRTTDSVEKDFTSELSDILTNAGVELKGDMAEKLKEVVHNEFTSHQKGIEKIEEKRAAEKANKQLQRKLKKLREDSYSLQKEIEELKESVSVKEQKAGQEIIKDIEEKIRASIQTDVEKQMKALTEKDKVIAEKEKSLLEKENSVLQLHRKMTEKEIAFRDELKKEKEIMESRFREEKDILQKNIDDLNGERMTLTKERDEVLDEKLEMQDGFDTELELLRKEKVEEEKTNRKEWKDLTGNMAALMKDEKELHQERDYQRRGFAKKEENIQEMAAEQIMASMEINEAKTNLEKEKEGFRQELKKKYGEEKEKIRKEMQEEFENFKKEQEQLQKGKDELFKEQEAVRDKEKVFSSVVEKMVNQKLSEQKEKLDKKEKYVAHQQKNLEKEEKLLLKEKSKLINEIKAGIGGKTSLLKLKDLVKQQEQMFSMKQTLRETEDSVHRRLVEEIKSQKKTATEEMEAKKKVIGEEGKRLENLRRHLNEKENTLAENKSKATRVMTKKYADLIAKKEKEFEKKEQEWQKKAMELNEREADFLKKQEKQLEQQKELSKGMVKKEEDAFKLMQENITGKEELIRSGKQLSKKEADLQQNHNKLMTKVKEGYQQKIQLLEKKSAAVSELETKLKEEQITIMAKADKAVEEYQEQLKPKQKELEKKESQLMEGMLDINQQREQLQEMRQEFENSQNQVFQDYKDKISGIDGVINQKVQDHVEKLMEEIEVKGETKKAYEVPSSGEGSVGDFGDEMELAAPPRFERLLTQDYSLSITVPPGEFFMGCDDIHESKPRHKVAIERPFKISKYPITIIQFLQFVKETGHLTSVEKRQVCGITVRGGDQIRRDRNNKVVEFTVRGPVVIDNEHASWKQPFGLENIFEQKFNHPVTMITWWDCRAYCDWLSQKAGVKCRLPTEKEWEYVASSRGQLKQGEFYWGSEERVEKHCNSQNSFIGDTTPVDQFLQNKTVDGVRDMLGNVWEWTLDVYSDYSGSHDTSDNKQEHKVVRGGSYVLDKGKINTFIRRTYKKMYASSCVGFRVVSEE